MTCFSRTQLTTRLTPFVLWSDRFPKICEDVYKGHFQADIEHPATDEQKETEAESVNDDAHQNIEDLVAKWHGHGQTWDFFFAWTLDYIPRETKLATHELFSPLQSILVKLKHGPLRRANILAVEPREPWTSDHLPRACKAGNKWVKGGGTSLGARGIGCVN